MIDYHKKILIVLPHLDDEFALAPLIKKINRTSKKNIFTIFCAERNISNELNKKRRAESVKSLRILGCDTNKITYINDFFNVDDLALHEAAFKIYHFLLGFLKKK